ncbi:MAG: ATP-binding protein [Geitlerinemataceae cyanobacterium]
MTLTSSTHDTSSQTLLEGIAIAANQLLVIEDDRDAVQQALVSLGRATETDRIYVFENHPHPETGVPTISQRWEWVARGITPELDNPNNKNIIWEEMLPRWYAAFLEKQTISGLVKDFPEGEREFLEAQGIQSILLVPMRVRDTFWGVIGFDDCRRERIWNEVEQAALTALAGTVGGAIIQRRTDAQLKQLNQDLERRVGDRTRELQREKEKAEQRSRELERALQQLQQAQTQLVQSEKMSALGQLVAGIAHEINNPLNFIYGNLELVEEYTDGVLELLAAYDRSYPEPTAELQDLRDDVDLEFLQQDLPAMLNSMRMGSERIVSIVRSLKTFSRADDSHRQAADLHVQIEDTLTILKTRLVREDSIQVLRDYGALPLVNCSTGQLGQVFMNLISNAIDSLEGVDAPTIRVRTRALGGAVSIAISDNGAGMSAETQAQIFNPFFTTKEVGKGTG